MDRPSPKSPLKAGWLLAGAGLCFAIQWVVAFPLRGAATKLESNYFTSLLRFQAAAATDAPLTLAGSSISGRLPGAEAGNAGIANLGTDGGSAGDGLRMLTRGDIKPGKWIVIEVNSIERVVSDPPSPMGKAVGGTAFKIGHRVPVFAYSARPSGMLYNAVLSHRAAGQHVARHWPLTLSPPPPADPPTASEKARLDEFVMMVRRLKDSGSKVLLAEYPSAPMRPAGRAITDRATAYIMSQADVPFTDLERQIPTESLQFTDSVHLAPGSASDVLASLEVLINSQP